jgi:hypothetical protein
MVISRIGNSFASFQKSKAEDYFDNYGTTFTRTRQTVTNNVSGRVSSVSEASITLKGDIQFVTNKDYQILKEGIANIGDGMFFCPARYDVVVEDVITDPNGDKFEITKYIEAEMTKGITIYKGFLCKRLPE